MYGFRLGQILVLLGWTAQQLFASLPGIQADFNCSNEEYSLDFFLHSVLFSACIKDASP
jgi:hypothetical protein